MTPIAFYIFAATCIFLVPASLFFNAITHLDEDGNDKGDF